MKMTADSEAGAAESESGGSRINSLKWHKTSAALMVASAVI